MIDIDQNKEIIKIPSSNNGVYLKLNKTLYGLARSEYNWCTNISNLLIDDMGFDLKTAVFINLN